MVSKEQKKAQTAPAEASKPVVAEQSKFAEADKIWKEIKDKPLQMFALTGQKVSDYCNPVNIEPNRCFLLYKASSVIPALEEAIGTKFNCEAMYKYVVVSRK